MTALLLTLPTAGGAAAAQPITAERAMEVYRDRLKPVADLDCPTADDPDEIVVCGRPPGEVDPYRLPLPIQRDPGEVVRHAGEPPSAVGMASGCIFSCPPAFGIDLGTAKKIVEGVRRVATGDN
jgi:hypothetical protein